MKAWITHLALRHGIRELEVEETSDPDKVRYWYPTGYFGGLFLKGEWHRSRESAVARAEEMRLAKIASLEKQLAKLRALRFEP